MSLRKQLYDSVLKFGVSGEDREDWQSLYCSTSFLPPLVAVFSVGLILIVPVGPLEMRDTSIIPDYS